MIRFFLQGPGPRARPALRAALLLAGVAMAVGSLAAMSLNAAPGGDVIDAKRGQIRALEAEVQRIDAQASDAADAHAAAVRRARDLRARIAETSRGLAETRAARVVALERLSERVVGLYAQDTPSLIEVLLASGGLTAAIDTQDALEAIGDRDRRIVEQIDATKARLTRLKADLESDRAAVEASVAESESRLSELRGLIGDRRAVIDDAQAALDRLVADDAQRRAGAAARARAAAAEAAAERALLRRSEPSAPAPSAPTVEAAPAPAAPAAPAAATRRRCVRRARADRPVRVGRQPEGGVGQRPVPGQVPVRPRHLAVARGLGRSGRRDRGRAGSHRCAPLRPPRPRALAGLRLPMRGSSPGPCAT